jgi:cytochrome c551/c552
MNIRFAPGKMSFLRPALALLLSVVFSSSLLAQDGKVLFENNCKSCHALDEVVVGPALRDVQKRHSNDWLKKWIKNSSSLVSAGDKEAVTVYNQYAKQAMPSFAFSDAELTSVIDYIKNAPKEEKKAAAASGSGDTAGASKEDTGFVTGILVVFSIVLVLILIVLVVVINVLRKVLSQRTDLNEDEKYLAEQKIDFAAVYKSKAFKFAIAFLFVSFVGKAALDGLMDLGMQQGYAPKQPIPFSHKIHAGKYKIDCAYCHTGVYKGKSANIPSSNICMNCHNTIKTDSPNLKNLYEAVKTGTPVEWVRVHNLPDLAYFNHSQHVKVGGLECQQCHGPIQEMEVVEQYSPLTMGWCINCHRETPVNTEGNHYYDKLVVLHKANSKEPMKVKDIGGLECSKCHY